VCLVHLADQTEIASALMTCQQGSLLVGKILSGDRVFVRGPPISESDSNSTATLTATMQLQACNCNSGCGCTTPTLKMQLQLHLRSHLLTTCLVAFPIPSSLASSHSLSLPTIQSLLTPIGIRGPSMIEPVKRHVQIGTVYK